VSKKVTCKHHFYELLLICCYLLANTAGFIKLRFNLTGYNPVIDTASQNNRKSHAISKMLFY